MPRVNDRRTIAAEGTQLAIVEAASRLFIERGYMATTLSGIASEAGVAIQTIYNSIGSKRDVLAKVLDYAAAGEHAPTPAPTYVLAQAAQEPDPRKSLDQLVEFWRDSRRRTAPFYRLLRQAAALDQEAAGLERARGEERLRSYRSGAALLAERGDLREGLSLDDAAAIIHATGHPDLYRFLVIEQNWTADHWATWVRSTLEAGLLAPQEPTDDQADGASSDSAS
jgi:AcrR family transcriptional regulator